MCNIKNFVFSKCKMVRNRKEKPTHYENYKNWLKNTKLKGSLFIFLVYSTCVGFIGFNKNPKRTLYAIFANNEASNAKFI